LAIFCLCYSGVNFWNTNILFRNLSHEERTKMELWAMAQEEYIQNQDLNNLTFEILQRSGQNPMIQVDAQGKILEIRNIDWDREKQDSIKLYQILEKIKKENLPILIQYKDTTGTLVIIKNSIMEILPHLKNYNTIPLALLLIIILFGAVLYFVFKTAKIAEQNRLVGCYGKRDRTSNWHPINFHDGMAHVIKEKHPKSSSLTEIEKDIERLNLITDRFSKVGSTPRTIL